MDARPAYQRRWALAIIGVLATVWFAAGLILQGLSQQQAMPRTASHSAIAPIPGLGIPPEPELLRLRDVAPQDALAINAAIPVAVLPNPAARPFSLNSASPVDRLRALECLTAAIYFEAATEPSDGQRAVAQVVLNRVRHPAYPRTVCGVVFQSSNRTTGCQFTFTCDGAIRRTPLAALWQRARKIADEALAGKVYSPVGWATHYHTNWVVPYWSSSLTKVANVGTHIFYRWEGGWGRPAAFRYQPDPLEPQIALMRHLTADPTSLAQAWKQLKAKLSLEPHCLWAPPSPRLI